MQQMAAVRHLLEKHTEAIRSALGVDHSAWLAGVDYRTGRAYLECGDIPAARELFRSAAAGGAREARLYRLWSEWYPWLNPSFQWLRRGKRRVARALSHLGLVENRWS